MGWHSIQLRRKYKKTFFELTVVSVIRFVINSLGKMHADVFIDYLKAHTLSQLENWTNLERAHKLVHGANASPVLINGLHCLVYRQALF